MTPGGGFATPWFDGGGNGLAIRFGFLGHSLTSCLRNRASRNDSEPLTDQLLNRSVTYMLWWHPVTFLAQELHPVHFAFPSMAFEI